MMERYGTLIHIVYGYQVRVQPFINGCPFKNDRAFISTRSALPVSVYKHPGVYKLSANMTG